MPALPQLGLPLSGNALPGTRPGRVPEFPSGSKYVNSGCRVMTIACVVQPSGGHPSEGFRANKQLR